MKFFPLVEAFVAGATAPGADLAVSRKQIGGIEYSVFDAAPDSLRDMFQMMLAHGDLPFVVSDDTRSSFAEIYDLSAKFAHVLTGQGVQKGDRVGIFMRNRSEWIIAFIGTLMAGAVATPLNSWWGAKELAYALHDSDATVLVADPKRAIRADEKPASDVKIKKILCCNEGRLDGWLCFEELLAARKETRPPAIAIYPEDNASLMYTSGSTGYPKGALSTNRQMVSAVLGYALMGLALKFYRNGGKMVEDSKQLSILLPIPLFHVTGCVVIFLVSILAGRKLVLMRKWDVTDAMRLIEKEQIQTLTGVPTQSADLMHAPDRDQYDLSSLNDLSAGGAARPADQVQALDSSFPDAKPLAGYGLTETNGIGAYIAGDAYLANPSSIGRAVAPIVELEIRDPANGAKIPDGERGEIWLKSVCNIKEYWKQPKATKEAFTDGWLHTGDVGVFDEQGLLYIVDRIKDIIIRGGENIATLEVEAAISKIDAVLECAVFGIPDKRLGEEVACVICLHEGAVLSAEQVHAALVPELATYKIPTKILIQHEQLPRIATGKIAKKQLRETLSV